MSWSLISAAPGPVPPVGDAAWGCVPAENREPLACFFAGTGPACVDAAVELCGEGPLCKDRHRRAAGTEGVQASVPRCRRLHAEESFPVVRTVGWQWLGEWGVGQAAQSTRHVRR